MVSLENTLRIPQHISYAALEDEAVLLNANTSQYFGLNDVGMRLWELLQAGQPLTEIYRALEQEYEVDGVQLQQDLVEILNQLAKNGLVEVVNG